jgi:hypothetical protein
LPSADHLIPLRHEKNEIQKSVLPTNLLIIQGSFWAR